MMTFDQAIEFGQTLWALAFFGGVSLILFFSLMAVAIVFFKWITKIAGLSLW